MIERKKNQRKHWKKKKRAIWERTEERKEVTPQLLHEGAPLETDKWLPFRYRYNLLIGVCC